MAVGKEIRIKIASVRNTQKITRAMEMVAASKMRRTQDRLQATRPYARKIARIIKHLAQANPEYKNPFMVERPVKRVGVVLVSSDRGLCGGLNSNLFRLLLRRMRAWGEAGVEVRLGVIGQKGASFFGGVGADVAAQVVRLGDTPHLEGIIGVLKVMLDAYGEGEIDELYVAHNEFVNTMTQKPKLECLAPIKAEELSDELKGHWDYLYEPDAKTVLDALITRYIESLVFQGLVENNACEQAARMVAMKSASDNAGKLIKELQLIYNKARQAAITQEIAEIVGGAAAV
ncbi:ATP synthase F1, gamma subunit [Methylococcus capsulatus str. Bath]|jgi:F-type H+-transporting ATPase subunit gamma|uniref:ATP synthase gamma chain n=1 Tax=Methylococcus capsulatus (strain ATCC 33009 / NCIMB 11132 / Bath) TaxID=243233 RepID=ATPG_METCA|nr:F0F1 ATP synthase subunit gamma [Methylococcus capsulatus]Q60CR5.1 RecName: Full=ATP synthase gamma chain; AltName: Full=ATP synthase F1 sector gamma subunit; AltName: Full=F-ATPase gamma subunit [Methylococcus capsulatus str. Bath]AAU90744.1 ATP synthase F1, gamma subunit [Methylococcus capsulatus str. Bath]UQN11426.1 F0F1 ATP synthase subunit gamma [Methylococcus capsulatus]